MDREGAYWAAVEKAHDGFAKAAAAYGTFAAYITLTNGSISDRQLLLNAPIKLPFLNLDVPIRVYFVIVPAMLLLLLSGLLTSAITLRQRRRAFAALPGRKHLGSYDTIFLPRTLLDPPLLARRSVLLGVVHIVLQFFALGVLPLAIAAFTLVTALPYHDSSLVWAGRGLVAGSAVMIVAHNARGLAHRDLAKLSRRTFSALKVGLGIVTGVASLGVLLVATLPEEPLEKALVRLTPSWFVTSIYPTSSYIGVPIDGPPAHTA